MLNEQTKAAVIALAMKLAAESGQDPGGTSGSGGCGAQGEQGKPRVLLPAEGRLVSEFAREVGEVMACNGVYLRESQPVVLDPVTRRLVDLDADCLRTYAEKNLVTVRMRKMEKDAPAVPVPMTMARDTARAVLVSHEFLAQQRPVRVVTEVPLPVLRVDGALELLGSGYDAASRVLVLKEGN